MIQRLHLTPHFSLSAQKHLSEISPTLSFRKAAPLILYPLSLLFFPKALFQVDMDIILSTYVFMCCLFLPLQWVLYDDKNCVFFTVISLAKNIIYAQVHEN